MRALDRWQQRHAMVGFVVGVVKKYGDDRGSSLAVMLTYYGFMAIFPLLLILTTILGFIGNAKIANSIIGTTLRQFPVYGEQIGKNTTHPLTGSVPALIVGIVVLLYGAMGVAQAAQHAMAQLWNVPGVTRPGFVARLVRGLLFFLALGVGMAVTAFVSGLATVGGHSVAMQIVTLLGSVALDVALYLMAFRIITPAQVATEHLLVAAAVGGFGYWVLLTIGTALIQHQLRNADAVYGQFAFVLGFMTWLNLVAQVSLYAVEVNVVLERKLWPRGIVQPPLTRADRQVLHDLAHQEERRPEEQVHVGFDPRDRGRDED
jgi:uncharacterized BrkB/YihY/UPF0761 family membrane protein